MRKHTLLALASLSLLTACATTQESQVATGTAIGAAVGAGVGNLISKDSRGTAIGAALGAAVGAGVGYQWGAKIHQMLAGLPPESGVTVANTQPNQPNSPSPVKITLPESVTFNSGSSVLKTDATTQNTLAKIAQAIQSQNYSSIVVAGHADAIGDANKNQQLSIDRAVAVTNYLTKSSIDTRRVRAEGRGSREPISDNNTANGKAQNRRVEITIYPA
jgi:outer membrane protein OmpA-like peptidoglycan-associated protein